MIGPKVTFRLARVRTGPRLDTVTPLPTRLARQLALAHYVEELVESGEIESYGETARRLGITRARISQVMALLNLSAKIQARILGGGLGVSERALRSIYREGDWLKQEEML